MGYFDHHYASNSDLKELVSRHEGRQKPSNIASLYNFGTGFHCGITEPHKLDRPALTASELDLIDRMSKRFWKDKMCSDLVSLSDFRREHEFYRRHRFGLEGTRCKLDGDSRAAKTILELKGLAVTTNKGFLESLLHLDYDQGGVWYLDNASGFVRYERVLIVGISKKDPDLLFKLLMDRNHAFYKSGKEKIVKGIRLWKSYGFN